jgi:hypothetical protein
MNPKPLSVEIESIFPANIEETSRKKKSKQAVSFESKGRQAAAGGQHNPIAVRSTGGLAAILVV